VARASPKSFAHHSAGRRSKGFDGQLKIAHAASQQLGAALRAGRCQLPLHQHQREAARTALQAMVAPVALGPITSSRRLVPVARVSGPRACDVGLMVGPGEKTFRCDRKEFLMRRWPVWAARASLRVRIPGQTATHRLPASAQPPLASSFAEAWLKAAAAGSRGWSTPGLKAQHQTGNRGRGAATPRLSLEIEPAAAHLQARSCSAGPASSPSRRGLPAIGGQLLSSSQGFGGQPTRVGHGQGDLSSGPRWRRRRFAGDAIRGRGVGIPVGAFPSL